MQIKDLDIKSNKIPLSEAEPKINPFAKSQPGMKDAQRRKRGDSVAGDEGPREPIRPNLARELSSFEIMTNAIPDGHKEDAELNDPREPDTRVYKWNKENQTWMYRDKESKTSAGFKSSTWTTLPYGPAEDDDGKPFVDKDGKQINTKYTRVWRHYVAKAYQKIKADGTDAPPAIATEPIPDKKKFTYGNTEYIYDKPQNTWFNKTTKQKVDKRSLLNATLFAEHGWKPNGEEPLPQGMKDKFLGFIASQLPKYLTKGGALGQDSKVSARNIGGVYGGKWGDLLGRMANAGLDKFFYKDTPEEPANSGVVDPDDMSGLDGRPPQGGIDNAPSVVVIDPKDYDKIPVDALGNSYKNLLKQVSTDISDKKDFSAVVMRNNEKARLKAVNTDDLNINDIFYYIGQEDSGKPGQWIKGKVKLKPKPNEKNVTVMTSRSPAGFPLNSWKMYVPIESSTTPADYNARSKDGAKRDLGQGNTNSQGNKNYSGVNTVELRQKVKFAVRTADEKNKQRSKSGSNEFIDPYKLLAISANATNEELKRRWKILAMMYHPEKGGDADVFKEINSAYQQIKKMRPGLK